MDNKKFLIFRIVLVIVSVISLCFIQIYQKKIKDEEQKAIDEKKNEITEEIIIDASKLYITNNQDYFSDYFKSDKLEIRIDTDDLVKSNLINNNDNYKGYVKVLNDEFTYVNNNSMLVDKLDSKEYQVNSNNEKDAYDLKYIYKGINPNNYIKYNDKIYRIIGVTNSNDLKVISTENTIEDKWGLSGDINYLKTDEEIIEEGYNGIFYVGYVRSETSDISSVMKNEKRNNTYTVGTPKYIGTYSYINISDIINASSLCKYSKVTDIKKDNGDIYLINMLNDTYTSISLENNMIYMINDKYSIIPSKIEEDVNIKKVIYISGFEKYKSGNGTEENPYEID